ncbi:glycosyltransferase family 2 protein [Selenomonas ruminantium]|uniref:glycosyltransferase family 2 protein n=1 Tax=Selenomonas ruminantium TaxID=971 RepID=UPI0003FC2495|nr:glycosyltransferase family 2 protein [Selenomonas ruminantium]
MNRNPSISIVIPVYNTAPYLRQCLDSILKQSYQNFEVICIDDGSNDESWNILQEYNAEYPMIHCKKNKENKGAGYCRNLGIKEAKGEYLIFLDSDDFFYPEMLKKGLESIRKNDADLVCWDAFEYDSNTNQLCYISRTSNYFRNKIDTPFSPCEFSKYIFDILPVAPWRRMYKREMIKKNRILYQNIQNSNDVYFGHISVLLAKRIVYLNEKLVIRRINRAGQISQSRGKNPYCTYQALLAIYKRLIQDNMFAMYRESFYHISLCSLLYSMYATGSDEYSRKSFKSFMLNDGWENIGMNNLSRKDFLSDFDFMKWESLIRKNDWDLALSLDIETMDLKKIITETKKVGKKFCLWGFGKRGKKFFDSAKLYELNIVCIVDGNSDLNGRKVGGLTIQPIEDQQVTFDTIILTNYYFYDAVKEALKANKIDGVSIVDIDTAIQYHIPIENCVY